MATILPRVPRLAVSLGFAGLIPFYVCAIALWVTASGPIANTAWLALLAYAAVIASFMGAVHWGLALHGLDTGGLTPPVLRQPGFSVVPALVAWLALLSPAPWVLVVLIILFPLIYLQDKRAAARGLAPDWYLDLRRPLTVLVEIPLIAALVRYFTLQ